MINKTFLIIVLLFVMVGCSTSGGKMKISSSNLQNGGVFPQKYSCDGEGKSPELSWSDFPRETKSFAFIMEDPDAPSGTYMHWLAINIPVHTNQISEGSAQISGAMILKNSSGKTEYVPPCPPNGTHRYIFKIFALSTEKIDGVDKDNFYDKIKIYMLDQAQLTTKYTR